MQKIYEERRSRYIWRFPDMDLSYCEIPKTGSSTSKTVLFRINYGLKPEQELQIGGGQLARAFPDSIVKSFQPQDFLGRILVIYRDPIARVKSAYRSIFLGRQKLTGPLSEYFNSHFQGFLDSAPSDGMLNHHKPMSWFFPEFLIDDPRSIFVNTADLSTLPAILGFDLAEFSSESEEMPHLLNVNKKLGDVDMTDAEIRSALGAAFENDFQMFERLSERSV